MIPSNRWLKAAGILSLVAVMALAAGCGKQRTKLSLNKTDKLLNEARNFNVEKHAKQQYDRAVQLRNQAEQFMNAGDFKQSVPTAREAVRTAREAVDRAKQFEATDQRNAADHEVQVMNYNNGAKEDPQLYQQILELQKKMHEKYAKQRWVATIELANEIKQKVEQLLLRLREQANADLVAVRAEYKRLIDEGGETHAMIYVQRVRDQISEIEKNIAPPIKNYLKAIAIAKQAMIDAQDGIIETKKKKCEIAIEEIQRNLIRAQQLKAEYFVPDLWNACTEDFEKLVSNFWRKQYDFVLSAAGRLKDQVATLIYQTRLASARYQRDKLAERIAELRNKKVETYLPGRLAPLEKALQQADDYFKKEAFEDCETVCKTAQLEADEIMKSFSALADQWIRKAQNIAKRAQTVYREMGRIFRQVHLTYTKPIDQALEDNKQAIKTDLGRRLNDMQANLALAEVKQTGEDYASAIELSRAVQDEATTVLATIYNVVAHNVISEIADEVTRYDREGAPEYAPKEMALTKQLLRDAIGLRDQGKFQESAAKAAEARAQLETTIQAIEVAAAQAIEKARAAVKEADKTKTSQLSPDKYQRALEYINEAKIQLETTRLKDAILTAKRAEALAREASRDAAAKWAKQAASEAKSKIADALRSGADIQAAALLKQANEDLAQAQQVLASADDLVGQKKFDEARAKYIEAKDLAVQAAEEANRAKFRLVDEAEAAIVEARSYEGWRYDLAGLTDAVLQLEQAKKAMAEGNYTLSHQLARKAAKRAAQVTEEAKKKALLKRLEVVDNLIGEATQTGGRYFSPRLLASLARDVDKLRVQYKPETYDSSAKRLAEVEARLQGLINTMPNLVEKWIGLQRERLSEIEQSEIPPTFAPKISEAKKFLRFAEMDFKRGKYRSAYSNLLVGRRLVDEVANDRAEMEYRKSVREVFDDLSDAMKDFDSFLSLDAKTLQGMTRGAWGEKKFIAIAGKAKPSDFRERVEGIYVKLQSLKPPESMKEFHQEALDLLRTARAAAVQYERLTILGEFSEGERREIIRKACDLMDKVRQRRAELEKALEPQMIAAK